MCERGRGVLASAREWATAVNEIDPVASLIVPAHNAEPFIRQALESVIAQAYRPMEIVVVDDGSIDGTAQVTRAIAEASDVPLRYAFQKNRGPAAARNRGIEMAEGEIIAFQDADDVWTEHELTTQLRLLAQRPTACVALGYTRAVRTTNDGGVGDCPGAMGRPGLVTVLQAALFRRTVFDQVGLLDETLLRGEDVDWFLRALEQNTEMVVHSDVVLLYRRHATSLTADHERGARALLLALKRSLDRRRRLTGPSE